MNNDSDGSIKVTIASGVARLTINRPDKRNALTRQMIEEMLDAVRQLATDETMRVFVLQANGAVFCAGMDLGEMQQRAGEPDANEHWQQDSVVYCELLKAIYLLHVPTIAAVSGPVLAGGMGMVTACDMMVASQNAFFSLPEPMRGITAAMVTPFLIHRIGAGQASFMLLSGERTSAEKAKAIGLCHDVVAEGEVAVRVDSLVKSICSGSKSALALTKRHIDECASINVIPLVDQSIRVSAKARETDDAREGLAAFLEKRKPNWQK